MSRINNKKHLKLMTSKLFLRPLSLLIFFSLYHYSLLSVADDVKFNTSVLDLKDRDNIDLSDFSSSGYIMPGEYPFYIKINSNAFPETVNISYITSPNNPKETIPCLSSEVVSLLNLKSEWSEAARFDNVNQCLIIDSIPGMVVNGSLSKESLSITVPQAYLEYSASDWDPPSRWDNGIAGLLFDYNVNSQFISPYDNRNSKNISGNGTLGFNLDAWRFRANWQGNYNQTSGSTSHKSWDWSQYYAYRAITAINAKLSLGEEYLHSGLFDSFRYLGASLMSDENMLPPNLRGYAPEVTGIAKSNAKVTISQQGRVIYETQVAPGPFRIQDLNDSINGKLDVRVEDQDGSVQEYQIDTATVPYLTRPGRVQFKIISGRPMNIDHKTEGPGFGLGEFSWGVSNGWSLFGGLLAAGDYNAVSAGVGRDLLAFGALSFDITTSRADIPHENTTYTGNSYRLSYSKRFEDYNSQVTFAGYRFSERDFMNMNQYIDRRYRDGMQSNSKELYTIMFNKYFTDIGLTTHLSYSHETYWNKPNTQRFSVNVSKYFDAGYMKNISLSLSAYRNKQNNKNDDAIYLGISVPWGDRGSFGYNASVNNHQDSHSVSYADNINDSDTYRVSAGLNQGGRGAFDGYYLHEGGNATLTATGSYVSSRYKSMGLSLQGGATVTPYGAALHRVTLPGASRILVDTEGAAGVPVKGYGLPTRTNMFGKAVIPDVSDYRRTSTSIDINKLPDNIEAIRTVQQLTLTEGAIGYREFEVLSGLKTMASIRLKSGSYPPFGASVVNRKKRELGIVNDNGAVYLSGINPGEDLFVRWGSSNQCRINVPQEINNESLNSLLLFCVDELINTDSNKIVEALVNPSRNIILNGNEVNNSLSPITN